MARVKLLNIIHDLVLFLHAGYGLANSVMTNNLITLEQILLIAGLEGVGMMNEKRHAVTIALVGDDTDVVFEDYDVATLPSGNIGKVGGEAVGVATKPNFEVLHPTKINIFIDNFDVVALGAGANVGVDQRHQIIAGAKQTEGDHIGANAVIIVGVAAGVVDTLVLRISGQISPGAP